MTKDSRKLPVVPGKTLPIVNSATSLKQTKPRTTQAVTRALKKLKFNPLNQLVNYVFPQLEPKDQATICLKLMEYQFPKLKSEESTRRKKKGSTIQINTQVNVPDNKPQQLSDQKSSLQDLLKIAQIDHAGDAK